MSISLQQTPNTGTSGGTTQLNITLGSTGVNGNGIVVTVGSTSAAPSSVTDDGGNTYTLRRTQNFFSSPFATIWDCSSISNSPTVIHVNFAASRACQATVYEVKGTITAHAGNAGAANSSNSSAGSFSTTTADTIVFAVIKDNTITAAPSGYTLDLNNTACGSAHNVYTTTQSSINPAWTNTIGGEACCIEAYTSTNTGSVVYNKSVASTLTLTETQTYVGVFPRSVSESLTLTSTPSYVDTFAPHLTSTLTLTETQTTTNVLGVSVNESLTFSQTIGLNKSLGQTVSETLTFTETQLPIGVAQKTVSESLTFTEAQTYVAVWSKSLSQGLGISSIPSTNNVLNLSVANTLTFTESQTIGGSVHTESASNTLTLTGTTIPTIVAGTSISETLTFTETQTTTNVLSVAVGETFHLVSTPAPNIVSNQEVDQSLTFTSHIAKAYVETVSSTLTFSQLMFPINQVFNFTDAVIRQQTPINSSGNNGGTLVLTFPSGTSPNNGIVLEVGNQSSSGTTITSITDDGGNTYTQVQDANNLGTPRSRIYYRSSAAPLTTITLHFSTTGNEVAAIAYEISGNISLDSGNANTANSTVQTPGAITTVAASTIIFALDTSLNPTPPTGWVDDGQQQGVRFIHNSYNTVQTGLNPAFSAISRFASAIQAFTSSNRGGIHAPITFTQTISETHNSTQLVSQNLNLAQPNRIPLNYVLNRAFNQSLTFSQNAVVTVSKHAESTITFTQDQTAEVVKTAKNTLDFGQLPAVELVVNRSVLNALGEYQTIICGPNIFNVTVSQTLTLTGQASGYDTKPVTEHLTLTQTVVGVGSKAVKEALALTQTIFVNKTLQQSASNTLIPTQSVKKNVSKAVQVHHYFGFNGFQKASKAYTVSASNTLTLTDLSTRQRYAKTVTQTLSLTQTITPSNWVGKSVQSHLILSQEANCNISAAVNVSNTLTFLATHKRYFQDTAFEVPNIQAFLSEDYTLLRAADSVVVLPNPQFGDGQGNTGEFTLRFSINGKTYTYVKNNNTTKLNYSFWLSRRKCRELQRFLQTYQAQMVELQNWKGEIWKVYITNNPFETSSVSMYTNGKPTNEERWDISLEFEGIKVN